MSNKFVRSSKFRHVLGTASKKDKCYDSLKISEAPHESNMSSVNCKFLAVVLHSQGGGKFIVLPLQKVTMMKCWLCILIIRLCRLGELISIILSSRDIREL